MCGVWQKHMYSLRLYLGRADSVAVGTLVRQAKRTPLEFAVSL